MKNNIVVGLLALAVAGVYYYLTDDIPQSLLADHVGADGLPKVYAWVLGLLAVLLMLKSWTARTVPVEPAAPEAGAAGIGDHLRVLGLLGLGVAYLLSISILGYALTIFLLLVAVTVYCGAKLSLRLLLISAAGSAVFWLMFVKMFQTSLPSGTLWQ